MDKLHERIKDFSDEHILEQYFNHQDEYQPEALKILKDEINLRKIDTDNYLSTIHSVGKTEHQSLNPENFIEFEHLFSSTDILIAVTILKENKIIFFVNNAEDSTIPLENRAFKEYTIHVHSEHEEQTHQLLDEHFEKKDGKYLLKISSPKDRLKAFSFHDVHLSDVEDQELIDVSFSNEEKTSIILFGKRLLEEADQIESTGERVIFYYDSVEELIELLKKSNTISIHKSQLLAILEILQIYCDDPSFPKTFDTTIMNILRFFIEN